MISCWKNPDGSLDSERGPIGNAPTVTRLEDDGTIRVGVRDPLPERMLFSSHLAENRSEYTVKIDDLGEGFIPASEWTYELLGPVYWSDLEVENYGLLVGELVVRELV